MMVVTEEDKWKHMADELWQKGYTYFRWGGFPPWERDLPNKGDKVVFLYYDGEQYFMYLMKTIAIGEQTMPFLEDIEDLHRVDDCTGYVLTNVVGPVIMEDCELYLPKELHNHLRINSWIYLSVINIQASMTYDVMNKSISIIQNVYEL